MTKWFWLPCTTYLSAILGCWWNAELLNDEGKMWNGKYVNVAVCILLKSCLMPVTCNHCCLCLCRSISRASFRATFKASKSKLDEFFKNPLDFGVPHLQFRFVGLLLFCDLEIQGLLVHLMTIIYNGWLGGWVVRMSNSRSWHCLVIYFWDRWPSLAGKLSWEL